MIASIDYNLLVDILDVMLVLVEMDKYLVLLEFVLELKELVLLHYVVHVVHA